MQSDLKVGCRKSVLDSDRRGATTPTAFSKKSGNSLTFGVSRTLGQGLELILDGNLRRKDQTVFSSLFGFDTSDVRTLTGGSVTPRAIFDGRLFGMPTKVTAGFDYYNSSIEARRSVCIAPEKIGIIDRPIPRPRTNSSAPIRQ